MIEDAKFIWGLVLIPLTWATKLIWVNHKELQEIKTNHPTWSDLKDEIQACSDQKDNAIGELKEDITYIRGKHDETQRILLDMAGKIK